MYSMVGFSHFFNLKFFISSVVGSAIPVLSRPVSSTIVAFHIARLKRIQSKLRTSSMKLKCSTYKAKKEIHISVSTLSWFIKRRQRFISLFQLYPGLRNQKMQPGGCRNLYAVACKQFIQVF